MLTVLTVKSFLLIKLKMSFLGRRLRRQGWTKYSSWRCNGKALVDAHNDADLIADELETQYGVGVFIRLEYQ
jgi:hypothetical protein